MSKTITRTFKIYSVVIKDARTGDILKSYATNEKQDNKKVAIAFIKENGQTNFIIDINEVEETREMELDFFLQNSKVVAPKASKEESLEVTQDSEQMV